MQLQKNRYGNIVVIDAIPEQHKHMMQSRLQPLCRKLGIDYADAVVEFSKWGPVKQGVVVLAKDVDALSEALVARDARNIKARAAREEKRKKVAKINADRFSADIEEYVTEIINEFPKISKDTAKHIALYSYQYGRVGYSDNSNRAYLATVAYIRHTCTPYDQLIRVFRADRYCGDAQEQAGIQVAPAIRKVIARWKGTA